MANIMSFKNVRNKVSRNGFDLSRRTCFTSKVGELLPVWWQYVLPGDSFNINLQSFVRTQPVNTASFGRLREYYDFFFVPLDQLWNKSSTVLTQMLDNSQHATSLNSKVNLEGILPYFYGINGFNTYLSALASSSYSTNIFGFKRDVCSAKLLSYLGYGQLDSNGNRLVYTGSTNSAVSIYPLLAYQKIYADFFRFTQWESPNPSSFNVDWMTGNGDLSLSSASFTDYSNETMFDLRYCNYQKDMFHGIMPNAQFGSTAAVPLTASFPSGGLAYQFQQNGNAQNFYPKPASLNTGHLIASDGDNVGAFTLNITGLSNAQISNLSILALRQAEALQRWKEVAQAAEEDYKQQIQAHWNVNVSDLLSGQCRYLGGINGSIQINEVVNTNLVNGDSSQPADLAGKGIGSQNGNITFNSQGEYGVIMCIYHALPILDYITTGTDAKLFHVRGDSFPIPEFDSVGMELLPNRSLVNSINWGSADSNVVDFLGYVPRYIDFKTDYDRCVGGFASIRAQSLQSWIIPYGDSEAGAFFSSDDPQEVPSGNPNTNLNGLQPTYYFTKVNPRIVDPMFSVSADDYIETDQLLNQCYVDCKVVRNLDVNGLPY